MNRACVSFVYVLARLGCMKRNNMDGYDKRSAFARRQRDRLIDGVKAGDPTNQFAMRMIWFILGLACAALGFVLFTILVR